MLTNAIKFVTGYKWLFAAFAALLLGAYVTGRIQGGNAVKASYAAAQLKAEKRARASDAAAADKRAVDTKTNELNERARNDAIEQAIEAGTDPRIALSCERLRQANVNPLPPICGR